MINKTYKKIIKELFLGRDESYRPILNGMTWEQFKKLINFSGQKKRTDIQVEITGS